MFILCSKKKYRIHLVSLDPIFYSSYPNICTISNKNVIMCDIIKDLCKANLIKRKSCNSFLNEKNPENRLTMFEELILASGKDGFKEFMGLLEYYPIGCKFFRFSHVFFSN